MRKNFLADVEREWKTCHFKLEYHLENFKEHFIIASRFKLFKTISTNAIGCIDLSLELNVKIYKPFEQFPKIGMLTQNGTTLFEIQNNMCCIRFYFIYQ